MKLLLISDTHGRLNQIDTLAAEMNCEAIIHSGNFGFYDDQSVDRLSERELDLQVLHSAFGEEEKRAVLALAMAEKREFVRGKIQLSDLPQYLSGKKRFVRPIYAVWGNHEDIEVVRKFHRREYLLLRSHCGTCLHKWTHYMTLGYRMNSDLMDWAECGALIAFDLCVDALLGAEIEPEQVAESIVIEPHGTS